LELAVFLELGPWSLELFQAFRLMNFVSPHLLWLLWLLLPLAALLVWSWRERQRLLTQFISPRLLESLTAGVSKQRRKARLVLFFAAVALLLFSLARPRWGFSLEETKQSGLDIVVAIDTSKSMLADDVQPNRLQRAKLAALDLMRLAGSDRLGLVAFAGGAFLQCPLSLDEEAFRQSVEFLDVNVIQQGGTALAEAIQAARSAFKEETENHKILVLFTDGEDNDDAEAATAAARDAHQAGMRIFTVGVGTPNGEVLSTKDPYGNRVFIKDAQGNVVKSRLNESLLQQIAKDTDGFYLPLTGARTMDVLYERGLAPLPKSDFSTRTLRQYHERFQWFIGAAILLLLAEMLLPERKSASPKSKVQSAKPAAAIAALLLCALNVLGAANDALKNYERGKFGAARDEFERLARKRPTDSRLRYNAGAAAFQDEDYDSALKHFNQTLSAKDLKLQEQSYYNLGNTHFRVGEKTQDPKAKQQQWEQAVHQFESALKLDANDPDAKFNLEFVKKKLEELKQQQQQQQQQDKQDQNKDEQKDKEKQQQQDKNKDEKQKSEEQKSEEQKQEEQKKQEQKKKDEQSQQQQQEQKKQDEQQAQDKRGKESDEAAQQQNYARVMQMTPQQAQQLLDAQKSEERAMIFQPQTVRTNRPKDRVFKDW
jgi:Ca-activated chloride channel homolog